jgi:uncharacterized protein YjbI with pentapeptide repeats
MHILWLRDKSKGRQANFQNAILKGVNLKRLNLEWVSFDDADLSDANFEHANLKHASFCRANLTRANFGFATLEHANLRGANLSDANLGCANLYAVSFDNTDLRGADLHYSCWTLTDTALECIWDAKQVGQLAYHALTLAQHSGVSISSLEQLKELANNSNRREKIV